MTGWLPQTCMRGVSENSCRVASSSQAHQGVFLQGGKMAFWLTRESAQEAERSRRCLDRLSADCLTGVPSQGGPEASDPCAAEVHPAQPLPPLQL